MAKTRQPLSMQCSRGTTTAMRATVSMANAREASPETDGKQTNPTADAAESAERNVTVHEGTDRTTHDVVTHETADTSQVAAQAEHVPTILAGHETVAAAAASPVNDHHAAMIVNPVANAADKTKVSRDRRSNSLLRRH